MGTFFNFHKKKHYVLMIILIIVGLFNRTLLWILWNIYNISSSYQDSIFWVVCLKWKCSPNFMYKYSWTKWHFLKNIGTLLKLHVLFYCMFRFLITFKVKLFLLLLVWLIKFYLLTYQVYLILRSYMGIPLISLSLYFFFIIVLVFFFFHV